jgi:hypothetical protein
VPVARLARGDDLLGEHEHLFVEVRRVHQGFRHPGRAAGLEHRLRCTGRGVHIERCGIRGARRDDVRTHAARADAERGDPEPDGDAAAALLVHGDLVQHDIGPHLVEVGGQLPRRARVGRPRAAAAEQVQRELDHGRLRGIAEQHRDRGARRQPRVDEVRRDVEDRGTDLPVGEPAFACHERFPLAVLLE